MILNEKNRNLIIILVSIIILVTLGIIALKSDNLTEFSNKGGNTNIQSLSGSSLSGNNIGLDKEKMVSFEVRTKSGEIIEDLSNTKVVLNQVPENIRSEIEKGNNTGSLVLSAKDSFGELYVNVTIPKEQLGETIVQPVEKEFFNEFINTDLSLDILKTFNEGKNNYKAGDIVFVSPKDSEKVFTGTINTIEESLVNVKISNDYRPFKNKELKIGLEEEIAGIGKTSIKNIDDQFIYLEYKNESPFAGKELKIGDKFPMTDSENEFYEVISINEDESVTIKQKNLHPLAGQETILYYTVE